MSRFNCDKSRLFVKISLIRSDISQSLPVSGPLGWCKITCWWVSMLLLLPSSWSFCKHLAVVLSMRSIVGACWNIIIIVNNLRTTLMIEPFIFILLVLWSHIMLVVIMLLPVAQCIGIFTHWGLDLVLSWIQVVLWKRCLPIVLQEVVASHWRLESWCHIV